MKWIAENWSFLLSCLSFVIGLVFTIINVITRTKALKKAKTEEERQLIMNDIKSAVHGLVDVAEVTFSDVNKSGSSKLLYVLKNVESLCTELGLAFDEEYWTSFVNKIVANINNVKTTKENEQTIKELIEQVKSKVSVYVDNANNLFKNIPLSKEYKVDYVLRLIKTQCQLLEINVYDRFDWVGLVEGYFKEE